MPMVFRKHYPNCVVIIDCFEIFIDQLTNLLACAQTLSQYKHHNTVKFFICSGCLGGRTSDKYITENSSFPSYLVPGDLILADRGLTFVTLWYLLFKSCNASFHQSKIPTIRNRS